jgi:ribose 5-phosphate isomerase B
MKKTIALGCDHAGYNLKLEIIKELQAKGFETVDFGCDSVESIDYPDYAHPVADYVEKNNTLGVLICGSGNGISMSANKHQGVRSAICWSQEIAALARQHNDANIVSLPARFITTDEAKEIIHTFFTTEFEGGRHERRVNKISCV